MSFEGDTYTDDDLSAILARHGKTPTPRRKLTRTTGRPEWDSLYEQAGNDNDVDPDLLLEQGRQETINFNPSVMSGRLNSPKGARGAGQFIADTAREYGLKVDNQVDERTDAQKSINAQARMMRKLLDRHNGNEEAALAAYNSGSNLDTQRALRNRNRIPETRGYVDNILGKYRKSEPTYSDDDLSNILSKYQSATSPQDTPASPIVSPQPAGQVAPSNPTANLQSAPNIPTYKTRPRVVSVPDTSPTIANTDAVQASYIPGQAAVVQPGTMLPKVRQQSRTGAQVEGQVNAPVTTTFTPGNAYVMGVSPEEVAADRARVATVQHTVSPTDTKESIARKYGITVDALLKANGVTNPSEADKVQAGTVIDIPKAIQPTRGSEVAVRARREAAVRQRRQQVAQGIPSITADDLQWHINMSADTFNGLSARDKAKVARGIANLKAADDARRRNGEEIPQPTAQQRNYFRQQLGLAQNPTSVNVGTRQNAPAFDFQSQRNGQIKFQPQTTGQKIASNASQNEQINQAIQEEMQRARSEDRPFDERLAENLKGRGISVDLSQVKGTQANATSEGKALRDRIRGEVLAERQNLQQGSTESQQALQASGYYSGQDEQQRVNAEVERRASAIEDAQRLQAETRSKYTPTDRAYIQESVSQLEKQGGYSRAVDVGQSKGLAGIERLAAGAFRLLNAGPESTKSETLSRLENTFRGLSQRELDVVDAALQKHPQTNAQSAVSFASELPANVLSIIALTELAGPVGGFALQGGLASLGAGESPQKAIESALKSGVIGKVFEGTNGMKLLQRATSVGTATFATEKATGASNEDALKSALTNSVFAITGEQVKGAFKGLAESKIGRPIADRIMTDPRVPDNIRDKFAEARDFRPLVVLSEDGARGLEVFARNGERFVREITPEEFAKYDPSQVTGKARHVRESVSLPDDLFNTLAEEAKTSAPVNRQIAPQSTQGQPEPSEGTQAASVPPTTEQAAEPQQRVSFDEYENGQPTGKTLSGTQVEMTPAWRKRLSDDGVNPNDYVAVRHDDGTINLVEAELIKKGDSPNEVKEQAAVDNQSSIPNGAGTSVENVRNDASVPASQTVSHPNPEIDGKPIVAETQDGRVIVPNPSNASGVSVVKNRRGIQVPDLPKNQEQQVPTFINKGAILQGSEDANAQIDRVGKQLTELQNQGYTFNRVVEGKRIPVEWNGKYLKDLREGVHKGNPWGLGAILFEKPNEGIEVIPPKAQGQSEAPPAIAATSVPDTSQGENANVASAVQTEAVRPEISNNAPHPPEYDDSTELLESVRQVELGSRPEDGAVDLVEKKPHEIIQAVLNSRYRNEVLREIPSGSRLVSAAGYYADFKTPKGDIIRIGHPAFVGLMRVKDGDAGVKFFGGRNNGAIVQRNPANPLPEISNPNSPYLPKRDVAPAKSESAAEGGGVVPESGDSYRNKSTGEVLAVRNAENNQVALGERGSDSKPSVTLPRTDFDKQFEKTEHKFSSTQVDLPKKEAGEVRALSEQLIPDSELYTDPNDDSYGREDAPHITVKYGLHTEQADDVCKALAGVRPFTVKLGDVSIFPAKGDAPYDVVKVGVDSPELHALNKTIAQALKVTDTHPEYKPHVTLAYVKKGAGQKYVGDKSLAGKTLTFDKVTFSSSNGETVEIPLEGSAPLSKQERAQQAEPTDTKASVIDVKDITIGDHVRTRSDKTTTGVTGIVKSIGRKNVKVETKTQFRPDGEIFTHEHVIPKSDIVEARRLPDGVGREKAEESSLKMAVRDDEPIFFSQLTRTIESKMSNRASVKEVRSLISNPQNGVKADEVKWSGLDDFLEGKESVTKREVLDFLAENNVRVEEVTKGEPSDAEIAAWWNDEGGANEETPFGSLSTTERADAVERYQDEVGRYDHEGSNTKFSQYTLPNAIEGSYRELLLTLPPKRIDKPIVVFNERTGEEVARFNNIPEAQERVRENPNVLDWKDISPSESGTYKSSHYDEPNILAHIRFNDRTDADDNKILFIEEIQSDWHQLGRKKGYKTGQAPNLTALHDEAVEAIRRNDNLGYDYATQALGDVVREGEDWRKAWDVDDYDAQIIQHYLDAEEAGKRERDAVPDAPFSQTWPELSMKRMLRYAAENGYNKVAWTTGEQQNARYDLSKHLSGVRAEKILYGTKAGEYEITGIDLNGKDVLHKAIPESELEGTVGKELAEKIISEADRYPDGHTYSGLDLKVGGEGMKGFYDKILPSFLNKYSKKWGARVQDADISFGKPYLQFQVGKHWYHESILRDAGYDPKTLRVGSKVFDEQLVRNIVEQDLPEPVHAISITPSMKEFVMQGQSLFMANREASRLRSIPNDTDLIPEIRSSVSGSTLIISPQTQELLRRAESENAASFDGQLLNPNQVKDTVKDLDEAAKIMRAKGYDERDAKKLDKLRHDLIRAARSGKGRVQVEVEESEPVVGWHEGQHFGSEVGHAARIVRKTRPDLVKQEDIDEEIAKTYAPLTDRLSEEKYRELDKRDFTESWWNHYGDAPQYVLDKQARDRGELWAIAKGVEEAVATAAGGDHAKLGQSDEAARDILVDWYDAYVEHNGLESLNEFKRYRDEVKEIIETTRDNYSRQAGRPVDEGLSGVQDEQPREAEREPIKVRQEPESKGRGEAVDDSLTGIKNATTEAERAARGLSPVEKQAYRAIGDAYVDGRNEVESGKIEPRSLAHIIAEKPRPLTATEVGALGYDRARLINQHRATVDAISQAIEAWDDLAISEGNDVLQRLEHELDLNDQALQKGGREQSAAFNARKMLIKEDYSLAALVTRAKARSGGEITSETRAKLDELSKKLEVAETELKEREDTIAKLRAEEGAQRIEREVKRENRRSKRAVSKEVLNKEFAELSHEFGKLAGRFTAGIDPELAIVIGKMAKNRVQAGIVKAEELVDEIYTTTKEHLDLSKRDIRDAISGYGKTSEPSKDAIETQLREAKAQMRLVSALEDAEAGQLPLKSGFQRGADSAKVKELRTQVNQIIKEQGLRAEKEKLSESARLRKQISTLDAKIADARKGIFPTKTTKEKSTLEAEHLKAERDLLQKQFEELRPKNPPKPPDPMVAVKTRLNKQIGEFERQLREKDYVKPTPRPQVMYDAEAARLRTKRNALRQQIDQEILKQEKTSVASIALKWRRAVLLSSVRTLGKLTGAATLRNVTTPIEELFGVPLSVVMPKLASKAPREGGASIVAEAKAVKQFFEKATYTDMWSKLTKGKGSLDVLYGRQSNERIRPILDFFGHLHGALKTQPQRAEFFRSLEKRTRHAALQGIDVTDPEVQLRLGTEAYGDSLRAILMNDNFITDAYKVALNYLDKRGMAGKITATAGRILMPIVKVPTNYAFEATSYIPGIGAAKGLGRTIASKGVENLTPEQADYVLRAYKKQGLGIALMALGYFLAAFVGGYFETGEKRDEKDVKEGEIRIFGITIPHTLTHSPALEALQFGATIRRVQEGMNQDSLSAKMKGSFSEGVYAATKGLAEEIPFVEEPIRIGRETKDSKSAKVFAGELVKSAVIPPDVQFLAKYYDKDANGDPIKRKPQTFMDSIRMGIPSLRKDVPLKVKEKDALKETLVKDIRRGENRDKELSDAVASGILTKRESERIVKDASLTKLQYQYKNLLERDAEMAQKAYERMTPEDKASVLPIRREYLLEQVDKKAKEKKEVENDAAFHRNVEEAAKTDPAGAAQLLEMKSRRKGLQAAQKTRKLEGKYGSEVDRQFTDEELNTILRRNGLGARP